jgi:XTP/dITP diphosphohydrolase
MGRKLGQGARLVLASHNPGKLREIEELVRPHHIAVVSAGALGLPEPAEDAPDFAGNARIKALAAAVASGLPALADDSGFCVAALGGDPGVLSARWAGPTKDFARAMATVHERMAGAADRRAWFVAALCLAWPDGHTETFLGRVEGSVVWPPRGEKGFGYDPIFLPSGARETFGEMEPSAKHAISHRARAFAQVLAACFG